MLSIRNVSQIRVMQKKCKDQIAVYININVCLCVGV